MSRYVCCKCRFLTFREPFFIAEEAQSWSEREGDLASELITQLWEETLSRLVLRVGIDAKHGDGTLDRDFFGLLHQGCRSSESTKCRIDRKAMYYDGRFFDVPTYLCIIGLLIQRDGSDTRDASVYFCDP